MPELTHDTAEDGFHEIQLSGKQLVFLFILVTFASVVIFLCGVLVGRGARSVQGDDSADVLAQVTTTPPVSQPQAAPPSTDPPAPAQEADDLSYPKRLQGAEPPKDELKAPAESKPAEPKAPEPRASPKEHAPVPANTPARTETPASPPAKPATAETPSAEPPASGRPGAWVVQVVALQDRAVAASLVKRLTGKGYPAFLVTTAGGSVPRMYKVQVGRYGDRREAEQIRQRLEKEEQFKPWISR